MSGDRICRSITRQSTADMRVLGVVEAANLAGMTEKAIRQRIARRTLPFRKLGGRIIFFKKELEEFLLNLPGCHPQEAQANMMARGGDHPFHGTRTM